MSDDLVNMAMDQSRTAKSVVVVGLLDGFRPGPQIGRVVTANQWNWLVYVFPGSTF